MVEAKFTLFEVKIKSNFRDTLQFRESYFCKTPKTFDAINVTLTARELIFRMVHSKMFFVTEVD